MIRHLIALLLVTVLCTSPAPVRADSGDQLVQQIVKLLKHPDREFQAAALEKVRTAAKAHTLAFVAELPKLEPATQAALVTALGDRGDDAARPAVLELLLTTKSDEVRNAATAALGELGNASDVPLLIKSLAGSGSEQQARTALTRLRGEPVLKALVAEAKSAAPATRATLIEILTARRVYGEMALFAAASIDENAQVRSAAMNAFGHLGRAPQVAEMIPGVLKASKGGERDNAERQSAEVCKRIENEEKRADTMIAAFNSTNPAQRDELLSLIGRVGGKKLIDFVGDIATGSDIARRAIGVDALSKWPDASVADKLLEIAEKSTTDEERSRAFQGYVKVAAARDQRPDKERVNRMKQAMKAARTPEEKSLVIHRCRTAYDVDSMRLVLPFVDEAPFAQVACETIVEIAHHRDVRDPHKAEFDTVLDKVIKTSKDAVVIDRANRYKRGETWERPKS